MTEPILFRQDRVAPPSAQVPAARSRGRSRSRPRRAACRECIPSQTPSAISGAASSAPARTPMHIDSAPGAARAHARERVQKFRVVGRVVGVRRRRSEPKKSPARRPGHRLRARSRRRCAAACARSAAACLAFNKAFSRKLAPVSSGGAIPSSPRLRRSKGRSASSARNSRSLPGLVVATTQRNLTTAPRGRRQLGGMQAGDPRGARGPAFGRVRGGEMHGPRRCPAPRRRRRRCS